jgi:hypothetical protein
MELMRLETAKILVSDDRGVTYGYLVLCTSKFGDTQARTVLNQIRDPTEELQKPYTL